MHGKHARKESVQACTSVTIDLGCLQSSRQSGNDSGPVLAPMHVPSAPNRRCWAQASLPGSFCGVRSTGGRCQQSYIRRL